MLLDDAARSGETFVGATGIRQWREAMAHEAGRPAFLARGAGWVDTLVGVRPALREGPLLGHALAALTAPVPPTADDDSHGVSQRRSPAAQPRGAERASRPGEPGRSVSRSAARADGQGRTFGSTAHRRARLAAVRPSGRIRTSATGSPTAPGRGRTIASGMPPDRPPRDVASPIAASVLRRWAGGPAGGDGMRSTPTRGTFVLPPRSSAGLRHVPPKTQGGVRDWFTAVVSRAAGILLERGVAFTPDTEAAALHRALASQGGQGLEGPTAPAHLVRGLRPAPAPAAARNDGDRRHEPASEDAPVHGPRPRPTSRAPAVSPRPPALAAPGRFDDRTEDAATDGPEVVPARGPDVRPYPHIAGQVHTSMAPSPLGQGSPRNLIRFQRPSPPSELGSADWSTGAVEDELDALSTKIGRILKDEARRHGIDV